MVRRHPHVFAGEPMKDWEEHKAEERGAGGLLAGIAKALPALVRAHKIQKRVATVGFYWNDVERVFEKLDKELAELRAALAQPDDRGAIADEIGDVLFTLVNLARHLMIDPEAALRWT